MSSIINNTADVEALSDSPELPNSEGEDSSESDDDLDESKPGDRQTDNR